MIVRIDEPLALHTAWRTGGRCGAWVIVDSVEELAEVTAECRAADWKWTLLGHGTRTVARDGEVTGAVIRLGGAFARVARDGATWRVGAGCPLPAIVASAAANGCAGLEALAAIPGSVGASVALDPGWDAVAASVEVLHRGKAVAMDPHDAREAKKVILSVDLSLSPDDPAAIARRTDKVLAASARAKSATPVSSWYAPPGKQSLREVFASVLLPRVRLREVAIPSTAPELLVNLGGGTAADLLLLHKSAVERVKSTRGLDLDSRVSWLGGAS
jgi:UDP-N-acetylmuramate dehydrogenase